MAFPVIIDSSSPAPGDSPGDGDDQIRALKQALADILGLTVGNIYSAPLVNAGSLLDGKVSAGLTIKAASPVFGRVIGTEASFIDFSWQEAAGVLTLRKNTGSEAVPTWVTILSVDLATGDFTIYSGTTFKGTLAHNNTVDRTYTLQDKDGTLADLNDITGNALEAVYESQVYG